MFSSCSDLHVRPTFLYMAKFLLFITILCRSEDAQQMEIDAIIEKFIYHIAILYWIRFIRHNLYNIILNFILCKMVSLQYIISNNAKNRLEYDEQHLAISVSCCIDWCLWDVLSCVPLFYPSFRLSKLWLTPHTQAATFNPIFWCFVTIYRNSLRQV